MRLVVVIPTLRVRIGRYLLPTMAAYLDNTPGVDVEFALMFDRPTWGAGLAEWFDSREPREYEQDEYVLYGADDLEPTNPRWFTEGRWIIEQGSLPAYTFMQSSLDGYYLMGGDFTRIPFMSMAQAAAFGRPTTTRYYTDLMFTAIGSEIGIPTWPVPGGPHFKHHNAMEGRIDSDDEDAAEYERQLADRYKELGIT